VVPWRNSRVHSFCGSRRQFEWWRARTTCVGPGGLWLWATIMQAAVWQSNPTDACVFVVAGARFSVRTGATRAPGIGLPTEYYRASFHTVD